MTFQPQHIINLKRDFQDGEEHLKTLNKGINLDLESMHLEEHSISHCPTTKISWLQTSKLRSFGRMALTYLKNPMKIATTQELSTRVAQQQLATVEA